MRWRFNWKPFVVRTLVALVVLGLFYGLIFLLPRFVRAERNKPKQQSSALRTQLDANYLVISSLVAFSDSSPAASPALANLRAQLNDSIKSLSDVSNHPIKQLDSNDIKELKALLDQEKQLLAQFDARYKALSKPLLYNPAEDLGKLSTTSQADELSQRAQEAAAVLKQLAGTSSFPVGEQTGTAEAFSSASNSFSLSNDTEQALTAESTCLSSLDQQLKAKDVPGASGARDYCVSLYPAVRKQSMLTITEQFHSSTKDLLAGLQSLASKIN